MLAITTSRKTGRMNQVVAELLKQDPKVTFVESTEPFDVLIDFTHPSYTIDMLQLCQTRQKPIVIGTTGLTAAHRDTIRQAAKVIPILLSSNMSPGVALYLKLLKEIARCGKDVDVEVIDFHHRHKKDAPSGTSFMMGEAIAETWGTTLEKIHKSSLSETKDVPLGKIGFSSLRAGEEIGEHTVIFAWEHEQIALTHKVSDRRVFAKGAILAAEWLVQQPAGLYDMQDMLKANI